MKKIIYIFVALLAFAVGTFIFFIRPLFITVSLNELQDNVKFFKSYKINIRGFFISQKGDSGFRYYLVTKETRCSIKEVDCRRYLKLELPHEVEGKVASLISEVTVEIDKTDFSKGDWGADVELSGYVDEWWANPHVNDGYAPVIKVDEIRQVSPAKFTKVEFWNLK
jgi:hypothetical protein